MKKIIFVFKRLFSMDYKNMFKTINKIHKRSKKSRLFLFFDIMYSSFKYQAGYTDYFLFYFEDLNKKQRSTYITRGINNNYIRLLNNRDYYKYFSDKVLFNKTFKDYIGRDYLDLTKTSITDFEKFIKVHKEIMVKEVEGSGGYGVSKVVIDKKTNVKELYKELLDSNRTLVEECVKQHKNMSKLCSSSVNTLRIVTITRNNKTNIMLKVIRMGNGVNAVDNFHSGGMYSIFNDEGIVTKPAVDREGNVHKIHPYTKVNIEGFKIPYYKEAIELVKKASKVIKEVSYVGFDVAITPSGPIIIEGNELPGYDLYQSKVHLNENKEGLKPLFDKIIYGRSEENEK